MLRSKTNVMMVNR